MAIRRIEYTVAAEGISPATVQQGGIQGEHNATELLFKLDDTLLEAVRKEAGEDKVYYRFETYNGAGNKVSTEPIELDNNSFSFLLKNTLTRFGGNIQIVFVISVIKDESAEMVLYSYPAILKLKNKPDGNDADIKEIDDVSALVLSAQKSAEIANGAATEAQNYMKAVTEVTEKAVTDAHEAATDAETYKEETEKMVQAASDHADSAQRAASEAHVDTEKNKSDIMRYIRDNCANALSEYREAFVIGLHDVSPLTDYLTAQLVSFDGAVTDKKLYVVGKNLWKHGAKNIVERAKSFDVDLRPGTYTLSAAVSTTYTGSSSIRIHDQTNNALLGFLTKDIESSLTFTLSSPCKKITLYAAPDYVTSAGQTATYNIIQIEASASASLYQPYIEPIEYIPDENGIVSGIVPILEGMTMYSDDNVLVTVNYNKDLQKVLESITNAIISLGGTI